MSGWRILVWCAACASGVLTFLKLVVNDIHLAVEAARRLEERERKASEERLGLQAETRPAAGGGDWTTKVHAADDLPDAAGG